MNAVASESGSSAVTRITSDPRSGWSQWRELWAYRELLAVLAVRDIRVRYKQTALGVLWAILQPLATMLLFTVVFGFLARVPSDGQPYAIFVFAGLVPWSFFSSSVSSAGLSLLSSQQLVSKVYFPRLIIPLAAVATSLVDFAMAAVILVAMLIYFDVGWSSNLVWLPLFFTLLVMLAVGVGTLLAALTVRFRDFRQVIPFLLQFWMFATPVIYPASLVPETYRWILFLNPMTGVVEGFRTCLLGQPMDIGSTLISVSAALVLVLFAVWVFGRLERQFADVI